MTRLLALVLMLAVLTGAQSTPHKKRRAEAAIIWSGNQLYDLCQNYKTDKLKGSLGPGCFMYIAGATQAILLTDDSETTMLSPCPGSGVTLEQVADVVIKWMDDHPEKRDMPAPYVVMKSLNEGFPCN